jgi:hypothetical protein
MRRMATRFGAVKGDQEKETLQSSATSSQRTPELRKSQISEPPLFLLSSYIIHLFLSLSFEGMEVDCRSLINVGIVLCYQIY